MAKRGLVAAAARGPAVADPCRRPRPAAARAGRSERASRPAGRARRRPAGRLEPSKSSARRSAARSGAGSRTLSDPARRCSASPPALDRLVRGDKAKLTADRAAYFCHPDWTVDARPRRAGRLVAARRSRPKQGLAATARWYRASRLALARDQRRSDHRDRGGEHADQEQGEAPVEPAELVVAQHAGHGRTGRAASRR